jgi:4-amino-4-deoxy-L-arabinose transferase-like glycosyltransferase
LTRPGTSPGFEIRSVFRSPAAMVIVALALRLLVMAFVYKLQLDPARDYFAFGYETGRIARSIASGQGFSSPYPDPTGPTALMAPVYPYFLAGVFKLFGIYTAASALVILSLNDLFASLTCLPVFLIARRVFGLRVATRAGWAWVLFPYSIALSNLWVWETSLTTLLLTLLLWATLHLERSESYRAWIGYALLWGLAALTSPAVLSTLPFLGAWIWLRHWRRGRNCTGPALAASLVFLVSVAPWLWRNDRTFGRFVTFRDNFGLEFLVGNNDDASRPDSLHILPADNPVEMKKVETMGEPAYMEQKQHEAKEFVEHHTLRFAELTIRRFVNTWTGLWSLHPHWSMDDSGLPYILWNSFLSLLAFAGVARAIRNERDGAIPLVVLLAFFPAIYYITHPDIRYRHPIDPVIVIFIVYMLTPVSLFVRSLGKQMRFGLAHSRALVSRALWNPRKSS